jgi:c-di-GMP-binding flagellar brake protein YcgR
MSFSSLRNPPDKKERAWQRRFQRHRTDFPVSVSLLRDSGYIELTGRCGDLGHGGMGVVLTGEVANDEVLSVKFHLPTSPVELVVRAIARYRKGLLHGLEFLGLSGEQESAVDQYCATLPGA